MRNILLSITAMLITTQIAMANTWQVRAVKDEFAGTSFTRIISDYVGLNKPLEFPYHDLRAAASVECDGGRETFELFFSKNPNLTNYTHLRVGNEIYQKVVVKAKLDDSDIKTFTGYIKSGGSRLSFIEAGEINAILTSKKVMLQMDFYSGTRHITIDMSKRQKCQTQLTKK
jgi:hypothetical protein